MRITKQELQDAHARASRAEALAAAALNLVLHGTKDATARAEFDGGRYTYALYGATRAHGGIVVETYFCKGQSPHSSARYLDDYRSPAELAALMPAAIAAAIGSLYRARHELTRTAAA